MTPETSSPLTTPLSAPLAIFECRGGPWDGDMFFWRGQSHVTLPGGSYWMAKRRTNAGAIVTEMWWL